MMKYLMLLIIVLGVAMIVVDAIYTPARLIFSKDAILVKSDPQKDPIVTLKLLKESYALGAKHGVLLGLKYSNSNNAEGLQLALLERTNMFNARVDSAFLRLDTSLMNTRALDSIGKDVIQDTNLLFRPIMDSLQENRLDIDSLMNY